MIVWLYILRFSIFLFLVFDICVWVGLLLNMLRRIWENTFYNALFLLLALKMANSNIPYFLPRSILLAFFASCFPFDSFFPRLKFAKSASTSSLIVLSYLVSKAY